MKRALILEDLPAAAAGLSVVLETVFPGIEQRQADCLAAARRLLTEFEPEIALIDLGLPDGSGLEIIERLRETRPDCFVVVTTIFADDVHLFPALRAGAQGYLLKDQPPSQLVRALAGIVDGEPPLSPAIARRLLGVFAPAEQHPDEKRLSPRERETLTLIAKGLKLGEVAEQLGITRHTAAGNLKSIYRKLRVSTRAEATLEAARMGLVRTAF